MEIIPHKDPAIFISSVDGKDPIKGSNDLIPYMVGKDPIKGSSDLITSMGDKDPT